MVGTFNFKKQLKPKNPEEKLQKEDVLKNLYNVFEGRERVLNAFDSKIFPIKTEPRVLQARSLTLNVISKY